MFAALHSAAESESVAVITPRITDRSLGVSSDRREHPNSSNQIRRPPRFINSGSLFRVRALREIGGAWERLHVDLVDSELAIRLDQAGWAELHVPTATLHHSLGHLQAHRMLRRVVFATNHSAARREAIGKGLALVLRRHGLSSRGTRTVLRNAIGNIISMLLFEEDRLKKLIAFVRGMRSGWFDHVQ